MSKSKQNVRKRTQRNNNKKRSRKRNGGNIPAAQSSRNRSRFTTSALSGSSVRVKGYDLVYATDEDEMVAQGAFCVIPCNPAYWTGTRAARIATAYSQYRPLKFKVRYFPQVSTMTNGLITAGTLWNNDTNPEAIQQALATSNSGKIYPVYVNNVHDVDLKTCLSQNLFSFNGYLSSETNPFMFLALTQSYDGGVPGYYMVEYEYDFKNPIGEGSQYDTVTKSVGELTTDDIWENTTGVLMTSSIALSVGTSLIIKVVEGAIQFFLNGSRLGMAADLVLKLFKSKTPSTQSIFDDDLRNTIAQVKCTIATSGSNYNTLTCTNPTLDDVLDITDYTFTIAAGFLFVCPEIEQTGKIDLLAYQFVSGIQNLDNWKEPGKRIYTLLDNNTHALADPRVPLFLGADSGNLTCSTTNSLYNNVLLNVAPAGDPITIVQYAQEAINWLGNIFLPPIEPSPTRIVGKGSRVVLSRPKKGSRAKYANIAKGSNEMLSLTHRAIRIDPA